VVPLTAVMGGCIGLLMTFAAVFVIALLFEAVRDGPEFLRTLLNGSRSSPITVLDVAWAFVRPFTTLTPLRRLFPAIPFGMGYSHGVIAMLTFAIMPLTSALAPVTLRRAKVHFSHIIRMSAWGLAWLPAAIMLPMLFILVADTVFSLFSPELAAMVFGPFSAVQLGTSLLSYSGVVLPSMLIVPLAYTGVWWFFAFKSYARVPRAAMLTFGLMVVSTLLAVLTTYLIVGPRALTSVFGGA